MNKIINQNSILLMFVFFILYILISQIYCNEINDIYLNIRCRHFYNQEHLKEVDEDVIECKGNFKCHLSRYTYHYTHGILLNGLFKFPKRYIKKYVYFAYSAERISRFPYTESIGDGKFENIKFLIGYRLFNTINHVSFSYLARYDIDTLIQNSIDNYGSIDEFMKRSDNIVYLQSAYWKQRRRYVSKLMEYVKIDSYGDDLNNMGTKIKKGDKIELYKKYKFCIAIENSIDVINPFGEYIYADYMDRDYVTEKLFDSFITGCIPIYFGPKTLYKYLPSNHSAIIIGEYKNIEELSKYIKEITNNKEELKKYFDWHKNYSKEWYNNFKGQYKFNICRVCERVKYYYYREKEFYGLNDND